MCKFFYIAIEFKVKHLSYPQVTTDKVLGGYCNRRLPENARTRSQKTYVMDHLKGSKGQLLIVL